MVVLESILVLETIAQWTPYPNVTIIYGVLMMAHILAWGGTQGEGHVIINRNTGWNM